jgi:hypothetical protein
LALAVTILTTVMRTLTAQFLRMKAPRLIQIALLVLLIVTVKQMLLGSEKMRGQENSVSIHSIACMALIRKVAVKNQVITNGLKV